MLTRAVVRVGIPVTAAVVVHRDKLPSAWAHVRAALAFDPGTRPSTTTSTADPSRVGGSPS